MASSKKPRRSIKEAVLAGCELIPGGQAMLGMAAFLLFAVLLSLLASLVEQRAYGFPEMISHGYQSCGACHASPVGGGALTPYGRGIAESVSTWARDGEGEPGYGLAGELPKWLMVGGDQRAIGLVAQDQDGNRQKDYFPMQADLELLLKLGPLTAGGSLGAYGKERSIEGRRNWLKLDVTDKLALRAGRFLPAYGINEPDHRLATREGLGLGEGAESYNLEASWASDEGEAIATFIFGNDTKFTASGAGGYDHETNTMTGMAWRGALNVGHHAQFGFSYLGISSFDAWRQAFGGFMSLGFLDGGFALCELDRKFETGKTQDLWLGKTGYGWRGLTGYVQSELAWPQRSSGAGLQWLPRPHWELQLEAKRSYSDGGYKDFTDSGVLLLHHYL